MKYIKTFSLVIIIVYSSICQSLTDKNISTTVNWSVADINIVCFTKQIDSSEFKIRELLFFKNSVSDKNLINYYRTIDQLIAIFPLGEDNSNLLTIWIRGSAYHIVVFSWVNGEIKVVLDTGSKLYPELIYNSNNLENINIIVSDLTWQKNKINGSLELLPNSAVLYKWRGDKYISYKIKNWSKRFYMNYE